MTNFPPVARRLRRVLAAAVGALVIGHSSSIIAAAPAAAVVAVQPARVADLVLLGGGFDAGLREGMVCRITRGTTDVGTVLLVELRPSHGAALILSLAPGEAIRPGDLASINVLKS